MKTQARDQIEMRTQSAVSMINLRAQRQEILEKMNKIPDNLNEADQTNGFQAAVANLNHPLRSSHFDDRFFQDFLFRENPHTEIHLIEILAPYVEGLFGNFSTNVTFQILQ